MTLGEAYEIVSKPVVTISSLPPRERSHPGLNAYELHVEALLMIEHCERPLTPTQMAYARYRFGGDTSGFDLLVYRIVSKLGTGVHHRHPIELLIRAHCGERLGLRQLRRMLGCGTLQASEYRNRVYAMLDGIHAKVMEKLNTRRLRSNPLLA